ncbi:probable uridine nucleosidase 2 [Chrysoperla carnea]|uniref:probable uridine nucleosidase 2 n=1 Tax=Chrysoperla carnea TaxID=189513 RepID=UPI001D0814DD|nr:probable uridine nucleosidase 2 [Chrysoperla carnea]
MVNQITIYLISSIIVIASCTEIIDKNLNYIRNLKHHKIIIDTDSGGDDAVAILSAIKFLETEKIDSKIIAITCVRGNTKLKHVKQNVLKTLKIANNLQIPVYSGAETSLLHDIESEEYYGVDGLGDFKFSNPPDINLIKTEHAVLALIRLVKENPGEISLMALGPLTNIALAIRLDPTFRKNLKHLLILGGSVSGYGNTPPNIEFNFFCDPESAHIVFNTTEDESISPLIILPWDTIMLHGDIEMEWRRNMLGSINSTAIDYLNKAERIAKRHYELKWQCSDGYLLSTALNPKIVTAAERYYASIVIQGELRGGVIADKNHVLQRYKNTIVITQVDMDAFKQHLLTYLSK